MQSEKKNLIYSKLWREEASPDDPFTANACYCAGYDLYQEVLTRATLPEYLLLLFRGERPQPAAARALEILAIAIANPGPRDPSVHAAMCAAVGGSPNAAALIAALAAGAGVSGGAREVFYAMQRWVVCGQDLAAWQQHTEQQVPASTKLEVWPAPEHPPGFAPYGTACANPVLLTLAELVPLLPGGALAWLAQHREALEAAVGRPLAMTGVIAAALHDLEFSPQTGEMVALLLRLPGAAAHALEQATSGLQRFPFFDIHISDDPATQKGVRA